MQDVILEGYTRVSTILSIFQAYSYVPTEKLKRAQEIGTDIHAAIESYFKDDFEPLGYKKITYFESFLKWADALHPVPVLMEERLYGTKAKVTGRIDLLATIDDIAYLIDFKTGSWAHPEVWELQMTFYRYLLEVNEYPIVPKRFMIVHLKKDGTEPTLYEYTYDKKNLKVCLYAWECYKFFTKALASN